MNIPRPAASQARDRARRLLRVPRAVVGLAIDVADRLEREADESAAECSDDEDARTLGRVAAKARRVSALLRAIYTKGGRR